MNIRRKGFEIKKYVYVIDPEHPSSKDYEVYYKGKLLKDVRGVIRIGGYEDLLQSTSHNKGLKTTKSKKTSPSKSGKA